MKGIIQFNISKFKHNVKYTERERESERKKERERERESKLAIVFSFYKCLIIVVIFYNVFMLFGI